MGLATTADLEWIAGMRQAPPARKVEIPPPRPSAEQKPAAVPAERGGENSAVTSSIPPAKPGFVYEPIACDNAYDFHAYFWPDFELYGWQERTLLQCSGFVEGTDDGLFLPPTSEKPLLYSLVAANGSGKSAIIVARLALWFIASKKDSIAVVTSATFDQLKNMTFRAIERAAEDVNAFLGEEFFICTECHIECPKTRSAIYGFATDKPGRAEGWHPEPGGEMLVLIDEAKTITDEMFTAFSRFSGYNAWVEVSSPGPMMGHFFDRTSKAEKCARNGREDVLELGVIYARHVTAFECPPNKNGGITASHIAQMRLLHGEQSALYRTSILAEFSSLEDGAIIRGEITHYSPPEWRTFGLPRMAGLDLSLGGDETVLSVWHGNKRIAQEIWHIEDSAILRDKCIAAFKKYDLLAENINADAGGIGKVVIQMIRSAGWEINAINNESPALHKKDFLNRGMEMYWKVLRLIEERILILPHEDTVCMMQLTTRQAKVQNGKLKLQSKSELSKSPDRADAMVLAFARVDLAEILLLAQQSADSVAPQESPARFRVTANVELTEQDMINILEARERKLAQRTTQEQARYATGRIAYRRDSDNSALTQTGKFSRYYRRGLTQ